MDSSRPPRTTPRKNDRPGRMTRKKEVDTARRRAYLFFVALFRGVFSVGGFPVAAR